MSSQHQYPFSEDNNDHKKAPYHQGAFYLQVTQLS
ncbi:Uncharacterised protein [Vibrio metschnikovii]|nr:Uncharacterised protein [Vibrio metschnikovii]